MNRTRAAAVGRPALALAALAAMACAPTTRTGPAPDARPVPDDRPAALAPRYAEADVAFMQGMIPHHAQAVEMSVLAPTHGASRAVRLAAERILVSQTDEIAWMTRWLQDRGAEAPGAHHHHGGAHPLMPGMLTPEEMAALAAATGADFDRLFLEGMIRHHGGALEMVAHLFATPGAAQASEVYRFATDVEADQQAEIQRMRAMLDVLPR